MSTDARAQLEMEIMAAVRQAIASAILFNHEVAERVGLGPSDGQFMTLLEVHGPLTPGRLAELSGLTTGTVTGVVDRLERAGFVRRERSPDDRRKVIVSRNAEVIEEKMTAHYEAPARHLFEVLRRYDEVQLKTIADFMTRLSAQP